MIEKIKVRLLALSALLTLAVPTLAPVAVSAATIQEAACSGAQDLQFGGSTACDSGTTEESLNDIIAKIINILSVIVGIIAVIMIVYGGLRYVTSGGDSTKVGSAKNTILYALIGLVIVAIAQVIVQFVLTTSTTTIVGGS